MAGLPTIHEKLQDAGYEELPPSSAKHHAAGPLNIGFCGNYPFLCVTDRFSLPYPWFLSTLLLLLVFREANMNGESRALLGDERYSRHRHFSGAVTMGIARMRCRKTLLLV